jgi:hypothetical protein
VLHSTQHRMQAGMLTFVKGVEQSRASWTVDEAKCNVFALGRVLSFHSPYIGKTGPYGLPMYI